MTVFSPLKKGEIETNLFMGYRSIRIQKHISSFELIAMPADVHLNVFPAHACESDSDIDLSSVLKSGPPENNISLILQSMNFRPPTVSYAVNICCVTIDVKPGQSYYIKMEMQSDLQTKLVIVNPEVAEKEISGCRRYKGLLTPN